MNRAPLPNAMRMPSLTQLRSRSSAGCSQNCACRLRELLDDRIDHRDHVVVVGSREPASRRLEVFEQHHVSAVVVELGVQHRGDAHRHVGRDVAVEARLGRSEARERDEVPLLLVERGQLHEQARRAFAVAPAAVGEREASPSGRPRMPVEHFGRDDVETENLGEPRRSDVVDVDRDRHGRTVHEPGDAAELQRLAVHELLVRADHVAVLRRELGGAGDGAFEHERFRGDLVNDAGRECVGPRIAAAGEQRVAQGRRGNVRRDDAVHRGDNGSPRSTSGRHQYPRSSRITM